MNHVKLALAAVLCIAVIAAALPASAAAREDLATVSVGAAAVVWQPSVSAERMVLTVSGPHGVSRHEFAAGTMPSFDIFASDGYPLADGSYTWELRAEPALGPQARKALAAARTSGDMSEVDGLRQQGLLPSGPQVQSGHFTVAGGAFLRRDEDEPQALSAPVAAGPGSSEIVSMSAADQVILDDLIVDGSACIGQDCVNGESFGFDTLRLKENNLRIKFQDTSNSASFPRNDWQLTANDSTNGGAEKFSIDDIDGGRTPFTLEAGAPSHSLYVDDGGRLGFGTSTPVVELHVVDGDSPTLRLEQDGSSGFTPQTWDVAGNETNFFVRDATNGSRLPFKIRPSAPSNSLFVNTNGDIGLGTASPGDSLHVVRSDGTAGVFIEENSGTQSSRTLLALENNGQINWQMERTDGTSGTWIVTHNGAQLTFTKVGTGANEMAILDNGDVQARGTFMGGIATPSARALKTDFAALDPQEVLAKVAGLPVGTWRYKARDEGVMHMGPMAEDFNRAFGVGMDDRIYLADANGVALAAIQGLNQVVADKQAELDELRSENADLEARLAALEALVQTLAE